MEMKFVSTTIILRMVSSLSYKLILTHKRFIGNLKDLLMWMKDNILTERPELFIQNGSVRPGILVLINDADYELYVSRTVLFYICCIKFLSFVFYH